MTIDLHCPSCGAPYGLDDKFCGECGAHLHEAGPVGGKPNRVPHEEARSVPATASVSGASDATSGRSRKLWMLGVLALAAVGGFIAINFSPADLDQGAVDLSRGGVVLEEEGGLNLEEERGVNLEEEPEVRPPPTTNDPCANIRCLRVVGDGSGLPVAMQARPRSFAQEVGMIPANARNVIPLGKTAMSASIDWIYVEYNGTQGWVPAQFLAQ